MTSADPDERVNAARNDERMLEFAREIGANTLLIGLGVAGEHTAYDDAYRRARDEIAGLVTKARSLGVSIGRTPDHLDPTSSTLAILHKWEGN